MVISYPAYFDRQPRRAAQHRVYLEIDPTDTERIELQTIGSVCYALQYLLAIGVKDTAIVDFGSHLLTKRETA